jgi:hypothetical protein
LSILHEEEQVNADKPKTWPVESRKISFEIMADGLRVGVEAD